MPRRRCPPCAVRASLLLLLVLAPVVCARPPPAAPPHPAAPELAFTPPDCLHGRAVDPATLPPACDHTWFVVSAAENRTSRATRAPGARAVLRFQAAAISWLSPPLSHAVVQPLGTADVFLDGRWLARVQLAPATPAAPAAWSATGLDAHVVHNLTIVSLGDGLVVVDLSSLVPSPPQSGTAAPAPVLFAASPDRGPAQKDGASGTIISLASIGAVAIVVLICGACFFLGRRRKSPGFHMPTVLVDSEDRLDTPVPPSPTTIRAWRESTHKPSDAAAAAAGEPARDRYPPNSAPAPRPPSYQSAKDSLYKSDDSSQSHQGPWQ